MEANGRIWKVYPLNPCELRRVLVDSGTRWKSFGRMGTPTDIAQGIVFLASDDAAFMTGAGLVIDGGTTAQ